LFERKRDYEMMGRIKVLYFMKMLSTRSDGILSGEEGGERCREVFKAFKLKTILLR
jgi:hypothetical protein